ncbi:MAG: DUF2007 domain-containing protein [Crocinitomicaceae bacterium]|nr:DUF2007 domain-containing protein [Crocinitomicaceae bacterium]
MSEWNTIHKTEDYSFAHIIKAHLEAEEIEVLLLDQLTNTYAPFSSVYHGGIRIQVREPDIEKAIQILIDKDYTILQKAKPNKVFDALAKFTRKISLFDKMRIEAAVLTLVTIVLAIALFIIYISVKDLK